MWKVAICMYQNNSIFRYNLSRDSKASRASQRSRWTAHFMRRRWQSRPSLLMGNQGGKALKWLPAHSDFEREIRLFFRKCGHKSGAGRGTGLSYTPCLLTKPVLCLRLHATQSQPCFPAASNVPALPGGNLIFAAAQTERITHYTLQAKSCAKGQAPLETPDNKTGWISHTFSVLDTQPLFVVSSPRFVVCV